MKIGTFLAAAVGIFTSARASEDRSEGVGLSANHDARSAIRDTSSFISLRRAALADPATSSGDASCPQVWYDIASDLKSNFAGCNRLAADAIRFAFHDAAGFSSKNQPYAPASGGADGSLLLNEEENARGINDPLQGYRDFLLGKYNQYKGKGVGAADLAQAAGNIGVVSCPGGPIVRTVIGRNDTTTAAPEGTLPAAFGPGSKRDVLLQLWAEKGFSPRELAALMGAHSVSRSFTQQAQGIPRGAPQDSTPRSWDLKYYSETQAKSPPRGVFRFDSDVNLAKPGHESGAAFTEFSKSRAAWATAFQDAMYKLSILGVSEEIKQGFKDCTGILGQSIAAASEEVATEDAEVV